MGLVVAALALVPSYWACFRAPSVGIYHDDAIYIGTARALAEGRGYQIESTPQPIPQTKYPVLFPALLAAAWKLTPQFWALKLVPLAGAVVWLALVYILLRRYQASAGVAVTVIVGTASSMLTVFLSGTVLSETVFAALATGCLLALSGRHVVIAALLAAVSFHTRTIGFCLIAAGAAALWWRGERRLAILFTTVSGALCTPWLVWQITHTQTQDAYLSQQNYYAAYNIAFNFTWAEKMRIVAVNLLYAVLLPQSFWGLMWGAAVGIIGVGLVLRSLFVSRWALEARLWIAASGLVILMWAWRSDRFWLPLLPLLLYAAVIGATKRIQPWILGLIWGLASLGAWNSREISLRSERSGLWLTAPNQSNDWTSFVEQANWLRLFAPPGAVVLGNMDPSIHLLSGHPAVRGTSGNAALLAYLGDARALGDAEALLGAIKRSQVQYVLDTPWAWFDESRLYTEFIDEIQRKYPGQLSLAYASADGRYRIFRVNSGSIGLK